MHSADSVEDSGAAGPDEDTDRAELVRKTLALDAQMSRCGLGGQNTYVPLRDGSTGRAQSNGDKPIIKFLQNLIDMTSLAPTFTKIENFAKRLGGSVAPCGSGSSHYKLTVGSSFAYFNMRHRPGSVERILSPLAVQNITSALQRAGLFSQHGIKLDEVVATSTTRKHGAGR